MFRRYLRGERPIGLGQSRTALRQPHRLQKVKTLLQTCTFHRTNQQNTQISNNLQQINHTQPTNIQAIKSAEGKVIEIDVKINI